MVMLVTGCGGDGNTETPQVDPADEPAVRILVLDDPPLAKAISRTWQERGEGEIEVSERTSDQVIDSPRKVLDADVVVFPAGMMGELAERDLIVPLESELRRDPNLALNDFLPAVRHTLMSWDRQVMGASFGVPQLLLLYRTDLLERLQVAPPTTWEAYYDLAAKVQDPTVFGDLIEAPNDWLGVCEPGGRWAGELLLAQAFTYLGESSTASSLWELRSMKPKLASPPFERALQRMAGAQVHRTLETPQACFHALLQGKCAMAVCWPTGAGLKDLDLPKKRLPVRVAKMPGAEEVYSGSQWESRPTGKPNRVILWGVDGRMISVTRDAQRRQAAAQRLVWLSGKEWGEMVGVASNATMPVRMSSRGLSSWTGNSLSDDGLASLSEALTEGEEPEKAMTTIRIPGRRQYISALAEAVESAQSGQPVNEVLRATVQRWDEITDDIGRDDQRAALGKSLGL